MVADPRTKDDYTPRLTEAAGRALVDVMQVLASFRDCLVLVGGWVPDLLLGDAEEPHVKSGDVDFALDVVKLNEGRYAEMLNLLLDTGRYLQGKMVSGAKNTVTLKVASVPDFLVMKSFALNGRDKPKDAYDICFCLDFYKGGIPELAEAWRERRTEDQDVAIAISLHEEKFETVDSFGPMQVVAFYNSPNEETRNEQARRSFELVQSFVSLVNG